MGRGVHFHRRRSTQGETLPPPCRRRRRTERGEGERPSGAGSHLHGENCDKICLIGSDPELGLLTKEFWPQSATFSKDFSAFPESFASDSDRKDERERDDIVLDSHRQLCMGRTWY